MALRRSDLLSYTEKAVSILVERGTFANGDTFRETQRDAITAYLKHLRDPLLPIGERLGYTFELSMALGKTAIYLGIFEEIFKLVKADGEQITGGVVVPLISIFDGIEDEIKKYAPSVIEHTTYYGAGQKETGGDFAVYTYDAFMNLVASNSIKLDVLFSDEAHRGTSESRAETYISRFLGKIVSIGLTATGAFDREKTIQKSHGKHGFKRSSADSIRLGELADYAQTQLHVIRVAPQAREPVFTSDQEKSRYYAALAKKAWTATTLSIFEHGKDEHTGDLLNDNIAAFYCSDIAHIEDTAKALNASAILTEKARLLNFDGVAVAIHSEMRRSERKAAKRAFDQGRYMAIVSDGVIKEGYNNSRIKNIFDYPRGSIVEKAQIIGRALRRYWNKAKDRWEGATIIDTVVYHGDDDIIKDQVKREGTILGVVTAWQILSDTVVYGPGSKPSKKSTTNSPLPPINIDGVSVESFTTIESINIVKAGLDAIANKRVSLDEALDDGATRRSRLTSECERTGLGAYAICGRLAAYCRNTGITMDAFSYKVLDTWLKGHVFNADAHHYSLVMEEYARAPSSMLGIKIDLRDVTDGKQTHQSLLLAERDRTGMGAQVIFSRLFERCKRQKISLDGVNHRMVQAWLDGNTFFASKAFLKLIMDEYGMAPTAASVTRIEFRVPILGGKSRYELLVAEKERTGLGNVEIAKLLLSRLPKNDPFHQMRIKEYVGSWFRHSNVKSVDQRLYDLVMAEYQLLPNTDLVLLDDCGEQSLSPRQHLQAERDRTGASGRRIFNALEAKHGTASPKLLGMNKSLISGYLANKDMLTISLARYNLLMSIYASLPDKASRPVLKADVGNVKTKDRSRSLPKLDKA